MSGIFSPKYKIESVLCTRQLALALYKREWKWGIPYWRRLNPDRLEIGWDQAAEILRAQMDKDLEAAERFWRIM